MANPNKYLGNILAGGINVTLNDAVGTEKGTVYIRNADPKIETKDREIFDAEYKPSDLLSWAVFHTFSGEIVQRSNITWVPEHGDSFLVTDGICAGNTFRVLSVGDKRTEHQENVWPITCKLDPQGPTS